MTDEQIIALARAVRDGGHWNQLDLIRFARLVAAATQAKPRCGCDMRTRLAGDGCAVCNPELAAALAEQEDAEPVAKYSDIVSDGGMDPRNKFDHNVGADRFKVVRGAFWWHVLIGDSPTEHGKFRSRAGAEKMAADLLREFRNGAFVQHKAALAEPEAEPVAWRWLYDGKPDGSGACFDGPGPDADIIERAKDSPFPRTVQYLWDGPPAKMRVATRLDTTKTAVVSDEYHWRPIETAPLGKKVQLLNPGGVAVYGTVTPKTMKDWLGWAPLPTRPK